MIAGGKQGRLLGGHFKRIISDPSWLKDFFDPRKVGGPVVDLHIHDAHFIRLICGMPQAVFSRGRPRGEVVEFIESQFIFEDRSLLISAASGVTRQQGRSFTHGFEIHLERATLLYDFAVIGGKPVLSTPLTVLDHRGNVQAGVEAGLIPMHATTANADEWDEYEWKYCRSIERYAREQPEDPDVPAMLERIRKWRDAYLRWGRDTLGFAVYLFYRPGPRIG